MKLAHSHILISFVGTFISFSSLAHADELSFEEIWQKIEREAPALKSLQSEVSASDQADTRATLTWLPRIYTLARAYSTNDPAASFFGNLSQRQITNSDFDPSTLNHPASHLYKQGSIGLDLPLFEGGARLAQIKGASATLKAKSWEFTSLKNKLFAEAAVYYSSLLALTEQKRQVEALTASTESILSSYKVGTQSNPVGYSGLLGLKNLKNRLTGLLADIDAKISIQKLHLAEMSLDLPASWKPKADRAKSFVDRYLSPTEETPKPSALQSAELHVQAIDQMGNIERSKYLPRLGVFAQGDLTSGNRDTSTSYTAGAYLQWDLFSPANYGVVSQARYTAQAAQASLEAIRRNLKSQRESAKAALKALQLNLKLLDESVDLLEKQTKTAKNLFQSGALNALQLAELLNRRADLIENRTRTELTLAETQASYYLATTSKDPSL